MTAINTSPFPQFKVFVVRDLQQRHQWPGRAGWELMRKFESAVAEFWQNGAPVDAVADYINTRYMERPVPTFSYPTREAMERVGCTYEDKK